jgi:hypothetical protein
MRAVIEKAPKHHFNEVNSDAQAANQTGRAGKTISSKATAVFSR